MSDRTVVLAAADMMTAYGKGIEACWQGLLENRHAFSPMTRFENDKFKTLIAGIMPGLVHDKDSSIPEKMLHYLAPIAMAAPEDTELFLASTVGEIDNLENPENRCTSDSLLEKALNIFQKKHGRIISAACASSNTAIARAAWMIRKGKLDSALIAGTDYVSEFIFSGFATLHAMSETPARPYDRNRDGLTLGDAGGILLLMEEQEALKHGYRPLLKIIGWGMSCDASHITAPMDSGEMLARAIRDCLNSAERSPDKIGAVIGHGTGTIYNDIMEIHALNLVFDRPLPLFSTKGGCGHTLAGAGIVQAVIGAKMLKTGLIPPQTNLHTPEPGAESMLSTEIRPLEKNCILSMNSGFGGLNTVLLLENVS